MEYPKVPLIIDVPDSFGFDIEEFFKFLLDNKVMPSPRKKYRLSRTGVSIGRAKNILPPTHIAKLKSMGLLTFVRRKGKLFILKDDLYTALRKYLKMKFISTQSLPHSKAA